MINPEFHTCCDCGYQWRHGQHGGHSCVERLKQQIEDINTNVVKNIEKLNEAIKIQLLGQAEMEAYDWNKLDNITYSSDGRLKMQTIRNGKDVNEEI